MTGRGIIIASGKGGVGKSTLCCTVGIALARRDKKVLIIDGDAGLRSQDILLGCSDRVVYDWGDVLCGNVHIADAIIHPESEHLPDLLAAPLLVDDYWTGKQFAEAVRPIYGSYDYVLIDSPAGVGAVPEMLCRGADMGIIVSGSDAMAVRGACAAGDMLAQNGVASTRLIINCVRAELVRGGKLPSLDSIIDRTEIRLIGVVPYDESLVILAADGTPDVCVDGLFDRAVTAVARRICGERIPLTRF